MTPANVIKTAPRYGGADTGRACKGSGRSTQHHQQLGDRKNQALQKAPQPPEGGTARHRRATQKGVRMTDLQQFTSAQITYSNQLKRTEPYEKNIDNRGSRRSAAE